MLVLPPNVLGYLVKSALGLEVEAPVWVLTVADAACLDGGSQTIRLNLYVLLRSLIADTVCSKGARHKLPFPFFESMH